MQITDHRHHFDDDARNLVEDRIILGRNSVRAAQRLLQVVFTALPLVCGVDKFTRVVSAWDRYLPPEVIRRAPVPADHLLYGIGIVEIALAFLVAFAPRAGAVAATGWMLASSACLASNGQYELALRDGLLSLVAVAFGRLTSGTRNL